MRKIVDACGYGQYSRGKCIAGHIMVAKRPAQVIVLQRLQGYYGMVSAQDANHVNEKRRLTGDTNIREF